MLIHLIKISLISFLFSFCTFIQASDKINWYSIEYVIFKTNSFNNPYLEPWTKEPLAIPDNAIALDELSFKNSFKALTPQQQQLHGVWRRLDKLSSYTPISEGGWIQPLKSRGAVTPIIINNQLTNELLKGTITLRRRRFLHLDIDLQLSEETKLVPAQIDLMDTTQQTTNYRLKQTRRLKTKELHYFDHPRFGLLIKIEKIEPPKKAPLQRGPSVSSKNSALLTAPP